MFDLRMYFSCAYYISLLLLHTVPVLPLSESINTSKWKCCIFLSFDGVFKKCLLNLEIG